MKLIKKIKLARGSVLVFTLIVLFIGVAAALGIASTTVISQKMAGTTGKSVGSFQVADSGAEIVLQKIYKKTTENTISDLFGVKCSGGIVKDSINSSSGKDYSVYFHDEEVANPSEFTTDCELEISKIDKIKSTGTYANTSRAVEMAVAAGGCFGDWESMNIDTSYQATTDGFVVVQLTATGPNQYLTGFGYTDANNPPTTPRASAGVDSVTGGEYNVRVYDNSFTMPVRGGHYWKVAGRITSSSTTIYWISLSC